jgi:hypothetical protein
MSFTLVTVMIEKVFTTRQKIADELGIDVKTFRRCLRKLNIDLNPGLVPIGIANEIKKILKQKGSLSIHSKNGMKFDHNKN